DLVHGHVRVHEIPQVSDNDAIRFHAGIFEKVELFDRRFAGNAGMREDRQIGRDVRLTDGAEYLTLVGGDLVPRADFAEHADRIVVGLLDQSLDDLLFAHGGDFFRIKRLRIESAARDDGHAGFHRNLANEVDVAAHVGMAAIDDAGDARALYLGDFVRHQV